MQLNNFEWGLIVAGTGIVCTIIGFFLKNVFQKNDKQSDDIQKVQMESPSRDELNGAISTLRDDYKLINNKIDSHDKDINEIKRTYVTKNELKEIKTELRSEVRDLKTELREENKQLTADVTEIKNNYIRRDDFYRTVSDLNRGIENIRDLIIKMNGGNDNVQK